jgi:hypothetical protein
MFRTMEFDLEILEKAIRATFSARNNALPDEMPIALTEEFSLDKCKTKQWNAFANRSNLIISVSHLPEVVREIRQQLSPVLSRLGIK